MKTCPFKDQNCGDHCGLYISPDELNELVQNKLSSLGVLNRGIGICALKTGALSLNRYIFENSITNIR